MAYSKDLRIRAVEYFQRQPNYQKATEEKRHKHWVCAELAQGLTIDRPLLWIVIEIFGHLFSVTSQVRSVGEWYEATRYYGFLFWCGPGKFC